MPLCIDSTYTDSEEDYGQSLPSTTPFSRLKGKQPEHGGNSDVVDIAPTPEYKRFCLTSSRTRTEGGSSDLGHLFLDSEQDHHVAGAGLTPWNYLELSTNMTDLEPGMSIAPQPAAISPNKSPMLPSFSYPSLDDAAPPNQLSTSLPLGHDIECSLPSWGPVSLTSLHASTPDHASYNPHLSCPMEEPVARYECPENFDYASDSPSDTSDSTTHTSYVWIDSEPSSTEVSITLQDDVPPFTTVGSSDVPLLFDSSDANAGVAGGSLLGGLQSTLKTREPLPTCNKRKRLFVAEEDEYGERARKRPRI